METIVDTLCTNMLSDKEQLRDISSIGLKTVIGELPPASSGNAARAFLSDSRCLMTGDNICSVSTRFRSGRQRLQEDNGSADERHRQAGRRVRAAGGAGHHGRHALQVRGCRSQPPGGAVSIPCIFFPISQKKFLIGLHTSDCTEAESQS